jgi:tetratricopeptide (TPR) repeat protein
MSCTAEFFCLFSAIALTPKRYCFTNPPMLKRLLNIIVICLCAVTSFSQADKELNSYVKSLKHFTAASSHKDHGLNYYLKFLRNGDANDFFFKGFRSEACENIASIYESQKQYLKAIAYYDSADTKYSNDFIHCGNGAFALQVQRRFKMSKCYLALNEPQNAFSILTSSMFDPLAFNLDSSVTNFYIDLLKRLYANEQAKKELSDGIENMKYDYHFEPGPDSTTRLLYVNCKLSVFGEEVEQAGYFVYVKSDDEAKEKLSWNNKESFTRYIKDQLTVYKKIQEL